jgi:hypothetical protein
MALRVLIAATIMQLSECGALPVQFETPSLSPKNGFKDGVVSNGVRGEKGSSDLRDTAIHEQLDAIDETGVARS